jgi:hypothetical protein
VGEQLPEALDELSDLRVQRRRGASSGSTTDNWSSIASTSGGGMDLGVR